MKRREHLMLKRAALASIQLEALPLVRVQAMADEELERTSGEILQRAHGRGQLATVKRLGPGGRPALSGRGIRQLPGLEQNRCKIGQREQFLCVLGKRRTLQLDRWHNDFADVLRFREAVRRMPEFDFQFWKQFPHVVEERRTIQLAAIRIELSAREHEPPAGARAGDVAEVTFVAEPMTRAGAEVGAPDREQAALSLVEERIGGRWRGKDALIHAEQEHEAKVGIARAIHGAD